MPPGRARRAEGCSGARTTDVSCARLTTNHVKLRGGAALQDRETWIRSRARPEHVGRKLVTV